MIQVRGLTRRFGDTTVVDDVSFEVPPGQLTGFVGGNGAGKTTTMRMVMGLLGLHGGEVLWDDRPITDADRRRARFIEVKNRQPASPAYPSRTDRASNSRT